MFTQKMLYLSTETKQNENRLVKILYLPLLEQVLLIATLSYIPSLSTVLESSPTNCPPSRLHVHVTKINKEHLVREPLTVLRTIQNKNKNHIYVYIYMYVAYLQRSYDLVYQTSSPTLLEMASFPCCTGQANWILSVQGFSTSHA